MEKTLFETIKEIMASGLSITLSQSEDMIQCKLANEEKEVRMSIVAKNSRNTEHTLSVAIISASKRLIEDYEATYR